MRKKNNNNNYIYIYIYTLFFIFLLEKLTSSSFSKVFTPSNNTPLIHHVFSLLRMSLLVVFGVKRSQKHSHCWKGFKYAEDAGKPIRIWETWEMFLKNSKQYYCSGQTRDSWTIFPKKNSHGLYVKPIYIYIYIYTHTWRGWTKCYAHYIYIFFVC